MAGPDLDVAVVGDGPAGLALAAACRRVGLSVSVVGSGRGWAATFGTWRDDVPDVPDGCFAHVSPTTIVHGRRRHELPRAFAVVDNDRLRAHLIAGIDVERACAQRVQHFTWGSRLLTSVGTIDARAVVDATGRPPALGAHRRAEPAATQTAFGVVAADPPAPYDDAALTLMDLRAVPGGGPATFCYVVPVADGWLVEETALAARPPVPPATLRDRLVARLGPAGHDLVGAAQRTETVAIPMGGRLPDLRQPVVAFGAAAGYTHPATGFSVAASLRAARRVAAALGDAAGGPDPRRAWDAVWPRQLRRTRRLHDYGLEVLLGLGADELADFFDAFFDLPVETWSSYLRIDARPSEVMGAMRGMLRRSPWSLRRRLVVNPFAGR